MKKLVANISSVMELTKFTKLFIGLFWFKLLYFNLKEKQTWKHIGWFVCMSITFSTHMYKKESVHMTFEMQDTLV